MWLGLYHEMLDVLGEVDEERRLWGELGEVLGIGPPPEEWFDREPESEPAGGDLPMRSEYPNERRP